SEYDWPESRREPVPAAKSVSVAIDGTYVRADGGMWLREYQVVAGRMERQGKLGDYFAWGPQHRLCFSKDYMKAALESNGWTPKSKVRVLADGADGMSNLVDAAVEKPTERVLDWFHIGMRMQPIEQMSSKIAIAVGDSELKQLLTERCRASDISGGTANGRRRWSASRPFIALPNDWRVPGPVKMRNGYADSGST